MAEFLQLKKYDKIPNQRANTSAFYKNVIRKEYEERFGCHLVFPDERGEGILITLEGPEGSGKSTILKELEEYLTEKGVDFISTREPGGVEIAEEIRNVILDKKNVKMDPLTETLLYAASRRQHLVEVIIPALKEGKVVLCDRYIDSSIAYQGYARDVGVDLVRDINKIVVKGFMPNMTLYFDVEPEIGLARINSNPDREVNRLDVETIEFHHKVRNAYLALWKENSHIKKIDASQPIEVVSHTAKKYLEGLLRETGDVLNL